MASAILMTCVRPRLRCFSRILVVDGNVAASTQNQALSALLFLYRDVLGADLPWMSGVIRPSVRRARLWW